MFTNYLRSLPLYDTLVSDLTKRVNENNISITPEYKAKLTQVLNSLDSSRSLEVTLLLIHYHFISNPENNPFTLTNLNSKTSRSNNLPYDIRINSSGKGVSFDIDKLPTPFQALLGTYWRL